MATVVKVVKIALVALVVIAVVLTGVPLVMGTAGMCADCEPGVLAQSLCLAATLTALGALTLLAASRFRHSETVLGGLQLQVVQERPPQLA